MLNDHQIAEILTTAADHIDDHGWLRFHSERYSRPRAHGEPGAVSVLGAIQQVLTASPSRSDTPRDDSRIGDVGQVVAYLDRRYVHLYPNGWFAQSGEPFMAWHSETDYPSFRPCRTKAEIVVFLRAAAGELRTDATDDDATERDHLGWACSECGEAVQEFPPQRIPPGCPRQNNSHLDGEPLCPIIGDFGYVPARPVPADADNGGAS